MSDFLAENIWLVLFVTFIYLSYLFSPSFKFFFIRPRQKKLDKEHSMVLRALKAEINRTSEDIEYLITILDATKSEVSLSMDVAKGKIPLDPGYFPSDVDPHIIAVLSHFMKKKRRLESPDRETFQPTSRQRRVGFAVHLLLSLALVIGLFFLSAPLRADSTTAAKDSSLVSVSDTVKERNYVASVNSDKFHVPSCRYADNISDENRVYYDSRGDALSDGKSPCSSCSP